jgi:PhnB protein
MTRKTTAVSAAPAGWHTVTPRIVARNAKGLVGFLCDVFGAGGKYESASPSVITIGDSKLMVSEAGERKPSAAFLYVYVHDPDAVYRRALAHGAASIEEPLETPYGDRRCMIEDRWGNTWQIARPQIGAPHE